MSKLISGIIGVGIGAAIAHILAHKPKRAPKRTGIVFIPQHRVVDFTPEHIKAALGKEDE